MESTLEITNWEAAGRIYIQEKNHKKNKKKIQKTRKKNITATLTLCAMVSLAIIMQILLTYYKQLKIWTFAHSKQKYSGFSKIKISKKKNKKMFAWWKY